MLILVRGPSGSGKSTYVDHFVPSCLHFEADDYFWLGDVQYNFDPGKLKAAHEWCHWRTVQALSKGYDVVVSNTFTRLWEMEKYLELTDDVEVHRCTGRYHNIHGVPDSVVQSMWDRMEDYPGEKYI